MRLWRPPVAPGERKALGLYRADGEAQLDGLLGALPLNGWMRISVTPARAAPNDPSSSRTRLLQLPDPRLTLVYRLDDRLFTSYLIDLVTSVLTTTPSRETLELLDASSRRRAEA